MSGPRSSTHRRARPSLVLGVDPGTAVTGYGVVAFDERMQPTLIECGVLRTQARDALHERLRMLHEGITELIARHHPDTLAVEDVFYARNVRTTVVLGHARGVILLAGSTASLDVRGMHFVLADEHLPEPIRRLCEEHGVEVIEPSFDPRACLAVAARMERAGLWSDPLTLVPLYPREPEAVTLWDKKLQAASKRQG